MMSDQVLPIAREEGLLLQEIAGELLVYDLERHKAHCLNKTAALVWRHCDGRTTTREMSEILQERLNVQIGEEIIWYTLEQLEKGKLLEKPFTWPVGTARLPRRELIRRIGLAAAVALPLITSIIAPTPAQAGTPCNTGASCTSPSQCASGCVQGCVGLPGPGVCA